MRQCWVSPKNFVTASFIVIPRGYQRQGDGLPSCHLSESSAGEVVSHSVATYGRRDENERGRAKPPVSVDSATGTRASTCHRLP